MSGSPPPQRFSKKMDPNGMLQNMVFDCMSNMLGNKKKSNTSQQWGDSEWFCDKMDRFCDDIVDGRKEAPRSMVMLVTEIAKSVYEKMVKEEHEEEALTERLNKCALCEELTTEERKAIEFVQSESTMNMLARNLGMDSKKFRELVNSGMRKYEGRKYSHGR